jgi:DNA polymerase-4
LPLAILEKNSDAARGEIVPLFAKVWKHCEARHVVARTVTLKLHYADFYQITRSRAVNAAIVKLVGLEKLAHASTACFLPTLRLLG